MIVLFDENSREYLRIYKGATEEQQQKGTEIREEDVPEKQGYRTIIKKVDDKIEYDFEEIVEEKTEIEKLQEELQNTKLEMSMAIVELTERIMNKDKANDDKSNEELDK